MSDRDDDCDDLWDAPTLDTEPEELDDEVPGSLRLALAACIQAARARLGWTVVRLAEETAVDRKTVSRVLNGHRADMGTVERLMRALRIEDQVVDAIGTSAGIH